MGKLLVLHIKTYRDGNNKCPFYCNFYLRPFSSLPDNKFEEQITLEKKYEGEWREPKGNKYRCIFNIVNDDDFVPKVPMGECGWTKYGQEARISIEKDLTHNYIMDLARGYNYNPSEIHSGLTIESSEITYKMYVVKDYKSNNSTVDDIVNNFTNIFVNKSNMRTEAYKYSIWDVIYTDENSLKAGLPKYASPFQKYSEHIDRAAQVT